MQSKMQFLCTHYVPDCICSHKCFKPIPGYSKRQQLYVCISLREGTCTPAESCVAQLRDHCVPFLGPACCHVRGVSLQSYSQATFVPCTEAIFACKVFYFEVWTQFSEEPENEMTVLLTLLCTFDMVLHMYIMPSLHTSAAKYKTLHCPQWLVVGPTACTYKVNIIFRAHSPWLRSPQLPSMRRLTGDHSRQRYSRSSLFTSWKLNALCTLVLHGTLARNHAVNLWSSRHARYMSVPCLLCTARHLRNQGAVCLRTSKCKISSRVL